MIIRNTFCCFSYRLCWCSYGTAVSSTHLNSSDDVVHTVYERVGCLGHYGSFETRFGTFRTAFFVVCSKPDVDAASNTQVLRNHPSLGQGPTMTTNAAPDATSKTQAMPPDSSAIGDVDAGLLGIAIVVRNN